MTDIQKENKSGGKVPNLRFPNFYSDWEVKKLGEISTNKSKKYNPNNETNFIKCIELEHLSSETGQLLGFVDGSQSGSIKNVFQKGDVLFGKLRPYLKKYYQPNFDGVCSSEIWVLNGKEILNDFLYYLIQTNSFVDLANQSSGSKMPRADWSILENGLFSFPNSEEQQKIASFLSLIDERIQTQNKIIEGLKKLKVATAKKIFSQELRFKDDNGNDFPEWEVREVGEVFKITRGNVLAMNLVSNQCNEKNTYPVYSSQTKNNGLAGYYTDFLFEDAITWTTDGANAGDVNYRSGKFYCTNVCGVLISNEGYANSCIAELINSVSKNYVSYVGNPKLMNGVMSEIKIPFPSLLEQIQIANFLSAIDTKIDIEKQLLQKLEEQKKYLLQQMFV